jgi:hypothetical protein
MDAGQPTPTVYPFGAPGEDVLLYDGGLTVGGKSASGRVWMSMTGDAGLRWTVEPLDWRSIPLGDTRLAFSHPQLGPLDIPARVTWSGGSGSVYSTTTGEVPELDELVVHWLDLPDVQPAEALESSAAVWSGRWSGSGGGWSFVLDAREDLSKVAAAAKDTPFHVLTHAGTLRRSDGRPFAPAEADGGLAGLHVGLSFALGRWVSPALAVGFVDGKRVWESWSTWRSDPLQSNYAWWSTHTGDDLRDFLALFLDCWVDPDRHDLVRHVAHHVIEANRSSMTTEARIMLAGAALEYLSWVTFVVRSGRSSEEHGRNSATHLRELLVRAHIPVEIPDDLDALARVPLDPGVPQDGPAAISWVRNKLVHPKDAREPYRLEHVVRQTWQLVMHYSELLLLREVGYTGAYKVRFPPGHWEHQTQPVPWAASAG